VEVESRTLFNDHTLIVLEAIDGKYCDIRRIFIQNCSDGDELRAETKPAEPLKKQITSNYGVLVYWRGVARDLEAQLEKKSMIRLKLTVIPCNPDMECHKQQN